MPTKLKPPLIQYIPDNNLGNSNSYQNTNNYKSTNIQHKHEKVLIVQSVSGQHSVLVNLKKEQEFSTAIYQSRQIMQSIKSPNHGGFLDKDTCPKYVKSHVNAWWHAQYNLNQQNIQTAYKYGIQINANQPTLASLVYAQQRLDALSAFKYAQTRFTRNDAEYYILDDIIKTNQRDVLYKGLEKIGFADEIFILNLS
ncbi:MAG: hypothetical protein RLZZ210_1125 [Pseudomonadota bacterium]|jgi:hypothetical protein